VGQKISIDPITRLEGHGRIDIFLNDDGQVQDCYLVIPELRGFENFLVGRPVEELPRITPRICGVCPEAHHAASAKAVDAVYGMTIPPTAELIRRLQYNAFVAGDHATHFYALGGPDFIMGPDAPPETRNLLGVIRKVGRDIATKVIRMRKEAHEVTEMLGGRTVHPVAMLPGGQSKPVTRDMQKRLVEIGSFMVDFAMFTQKLFADIVLARPEYLDLINSPDFKLETYYLAQVNENNEPDVYDGTIRVVDPGGEEVCQYHPSEYLDHIGEHVVSWSYLKVPFLKKIGWRGFREGKESGVARVAPLGMLNASEHMQTPRAQEERQKMFDTFGRKPVHATLAYHWARIIEMLQCAELVQAYAGDEDLTSPDIRILPSKTPHEGVGVVEAPRGLLTHHYVTDDKGIVQKVNLIEPLLNTIEMAFRAYDPCFACATHALPGRLPLKINLFSPDGELIETVPS